VVNGAVPHGIQPMLMVSEAEPHGLVRLCLIHGALAEPKAHHPTPPA